MHMSEKNESNEKKKPDLAGVIEKITQEALDDVNGGFDFGAFGKTGGAQKLEE
jgi:hypothetical protein